MSELDSLERSTFERAESLARVLISAGFSHSTAKLLREDIDLARSCLHGRIFEIRMKCERHARGNCPRRSCPDDRVNVLAFEVRRNFRRARGVLHHLVTNINRGAR